MNINSLQTLF